MWNAKAHRRARQWAANFRMRRSRVVVSGEWGRPLEGGGGTGWMDGPHAGGRTPMLPGRWIGDAYEGLRIAFCCESRAGWLRLGLKLVLRGRHCRSHHARTHTRHARPDCTGHYLRHRHHHHHSCRPRAVTRREEKEEGGGGGVAGRDAVRPGGRNGLVHDGVRVWGVVLLLLLWLWRCGRWDRSSYGIVRWCCGSGCCCCVVAMLFICTRRLCTRTK